MNAIQRTSAPLASVFLGVALGCAVGPGDNAKPQDPPANPVAIGAAGQALECLPDAAAINQLACKADADCGEPSLECRPHTGLCMPVESTPCLFDDDPATEQCGADQQCVQRYCIPDSVTWVEPRPCMVDSDCVTYTDTGAVAAGSTRCNHRAGGFCLAECVEGEACSNGDCGCDGRCPSEEAPIRLYRPTLQVRRTVVAFAGATTEYPSRSVDLTVSLDTRAFGTETTVELGDVLMIAGPGLQVATQAADALWCVVDWSELETAVYGKECMVPITLDKQDAARSGVARSVWVRPRLNTPSTAMELRLVAPWATPQSTSVGVRIMDPYVAPDEVVAEELGISAKQGVFRGHVLLSPRTYVEDYGQKFEGVVAQAIPVIARMGLITSECAAGWCDYDQHFEVESESGVLGQPYPLRMKLIWATYLGELDEQLLIIEDGNVWTEAALAFAYREGELPPAGDGELQRFEDNEVVVPVVPLFSGPWSVSADGEHVEGTTEISLQPYLVINSDGDSRILTNSFMLRLDLVLDYESSLSNPPDGTRELQYDKDSLLARPFQTKNELYDLVAGYVASVPVEELHALAACFSADGRKALREGLGHEDVGFECAQRMLCYRPGDSAPTESTVRHLGTSVLPRSGELACGSGSSEAGRWEAIPGLAGFGEAGEDTTVGELLVACYQELTEPFLETLRNLSPNGDGLEQLEELLSHNAQCIDLARYYAAIAAIVAEYGHSQDVRSEDVTQQYYTANATGADDSNAKRLLHRLLSQWLELHSFVARETVSEASLLAVFRDDPYASELVQDAEGVPSLEEVVELMEQSWALLLHPAMARPMAPYRTFELASPPTDPNNRAGFLYPGYVRAPDYRTALVANPPDRPQYDQDVALPVRILEGLVAHFEVLEAYMRQVAEDEYASCTSGGITSRQEAALAHYGVASRYALALEQLARDMQSVATLTHVDPAAEVPAEDKMQVTAPNGDTIWVVRRELPVERRVGPTWVSSLAQAPEMPAWNKGWNIALEEFLRARDRVSAVAQSIADCNAMGISDKDTPLYFGDPVGTSSRYFAASDYLINTWALPAVQSAYSRLDAAREAWLAETRTRVQDIANEFDYARRIEQLKESYGRSIVEACGLSMSAQDVLDRFVELPVISTGGYQFGVELDPGPVRSEFEAYKDWLNKDPCAEPVDVERCPPAEEDSDEDDSAEEDSNEHEPEQDARYDRDLFPGNCHVVRTNACRNVLQRIWDETAWASSKFGKDGNCKDERTYAWISKSRVLRDICTMAYSVPSTERVSLLNAADSNPGLVLLDDVFNAKSITYTTRVNSTAFPELSDHEIYEFAAETHSVLDTIALTDCNQTVTYTGGADIPLSALYDPYLSFDERWAQLPRLRGELEEARSNSRPYTIKTHCTKKPNQVDYCVKEKLGDPLAPYEPVMSGYTQLYCGAGDSTVDFYGVDVECDLSSRQAMRAASNVADLFFNRVDQYCLDYTDRHYYESLAADDSQAALNALDPAALAGCLAGELGSADIEILMARQRVRIAEAALATLNANIFLRSHHCIQKMELGNARNNLLVLQNAAEEETKKKITRLQQSSSVIGTVFAAASGFVGALSEAKPGPFFQGLVDATQSALQSEVEADIADVEKAHLELTNEYEEMIAAINLEETLADCWLGVDLVKQELDDQVETIRHELLGVANALQRRNQLVQRVGNALRDGKATVERETERRVPSLAHHHWVTEHVSRFHEEMAWAKRLAYLAVRAVEYEFQQSLNVRSMVLDARHPSELESALLELEREQASRTINRNRPEDDVFVLSVRDDLLDPSPQPAATDTVSGTLMQIDRLRERVMAPKNAVYDRNGTYLGQGLHLYLSPHGELEYRCGERLWRVTATVQGDVLGADAPNVPVFLLKQNTFKSQWCNGHGDPDSDYDDADQYQYGYVQASAQLFRPDGSTNDGEGIDAYTWALLNAQVNTPKSAFYAAAYQEGASEEFAGRGLYGEYILLFPWHGLREDDFALENIEDVLLRFDYLSVSDGPSEVSFP